MLERGRTTYVLGKVDMVAPLTVDLHKYFCRLECHSDDR